jgi:hypothetical protein
MIFRKGLIVLLLVLAGILLIVLAFGGDTLFSSALHRYGPVAIGQPLDFDDAQLSLLEGRAGIDGLVIGTNKRELARFGNITIDASTLGLIDGRLNIEEASINQVHLNLEIDQNGQLIFDPGPPPAGTAQSSGTGGNQAGAKTSTPAADRDLVQIVQEYWQRYQTYQEYYDEYGGVFGDSEESDGEASGAANGRSILRGKPAYLKNRAAADAGSFYLTKAEIADFSWTTLDQRTGKPILPEIEKGSITLLSLGSPPESEGAEEEPGPATMHVEANLLDGGLIRLSYSQPHTKGPTRLMAEIKSMPMDSLKEAINQSLPFDLQGGLVDVLTKNINFTNDSLRGQIHLELRNVVLAPRPNSKAVLGIKPADFCRVLNQGMQDHPVAFDFLLGGTPTDPTFEIQNATNLEDLILDALTDEAKARLDAEVDKPKSRAQAEVDKARAKLGDKAKAKLGDKAKSLFGGKKKGG